MSKPFSLGAHSAIIQHFIIAVYSFNAGIIISIIVYILNTITKGKWTYFDDIKMISIFIIVNFSISYSFTIKLVNPILTDYFKIDETYQIPNDFAMQAIVFLIPTSLLIYATIAFTTLIGQTFDKKAGHEIVLKKAQKCNDTIVFIGKNKNDNLTVSVENCIYIQSQGHYVNIVYKDSEILTIKTDTLRMSMAQVELCIKNISPIIRCHKSYFINVSYIKRIKFDGLKYKVLLLDPDVIIPVSKEKADLVKLKKEEHSSIQ
ncbi:LytTR family DNA-binding domain-containing protein [Tenacibaculum xiamenense]|uniref:LytTR family DNA-binding domain-containing protein n=1 Tax=Tenacibaculum xiamenense TaxID=1261553 RepID=UPI0038B6684C